MNGWMTGLILTVLPWFFYLMAYLLLLMLSLLYHLQLKLLGGSQQMVKDIRLDGLVLGSISFGGETVDLQRQAFGRALQLPDEDQFFLIDLATAFKIILHILPENAYVGQLVTVDDLVGIIHGSAFFLDFGFLVVDISLYKVYFF